MADARLGVGLLAGARRRVGLALVPVAALWLGVLWAASGVRPAGEAAPAPAPEPVLQTLAASGDSVPIGGNFDSFELAGQAIAAPSNRDGTVVFFASLARSKAEEGLFIVRGGRIAKLAATGDAVPSGERIADFTDHPGPVLNDAGAVAFAASLTGGKAAGGVFVAVDGRLDPVALSGAAAPEIAGGTLTSLERPVLDASGDVALLASVRHGRDNADAILLRHGGRLRKLVAAGDPAPGGGVFSGLGAPAINNKGAVAFPAIVDQGPNLGGLYLVADGEARAALIAGSPAPNGGILAKFSEQVAINDRGDIAFSAVLRQTGAGAGIFVLEHDVARAIAQIGDPAPGGGIFAGFASWPVLSQTGIVGFVAAVDGGPSPTAIFSAAPGGLARVAGVGDTLSGGGRIAAFARFPAIAIGPDGAITFAAAVEHDGVSREVLFYYGPPRR